MHDATPAPKSMTSSLKSGGSSGTQLARPAGKRRGWSVREGRSKSSACQRRKVRAGRGAQHAHADV
eukprot:50139-Rhodomonas_salina.2